MIRITKVLILFVLFAAGSGGAFGAITKSVESCNSGVPGIECEKRMTRTNLRNDGMGDWLHSSDQFYFRNVSGPRSCEFTIDRGTASLNNARVTYSRTSSNRGFGWEGLLEVEQQSEGAWSYNNLKWLIKCNQ